MAVRAALAALVALLLVAGPAWGQGSAGVAALQTALSVKGMYDGTIDGVAGPQTRSAVRRFQRTVGLTPDGVAGKRTKRALGRYGRHRIGSRVLHRGNFGWDVAALQFQLAWHGFASGNFDAVFGERSRAALLAFQEWAGLAADGRAGPATWSALQQSPASCPIRLGWPLPGPIASRFGPRGSRFHEGIDIDAREGVRVGASRSGRVVFAGWNDGFGQLVILAHHHGVTTYYAHLSRILVIEGQRLSAGDTLGRVGHTGNATGPHLHFEIRVGGDNGSRIDPYPTLKSAGC
jgi:murein DD-endopeptidase MepM/ murein hydrolase activator NlpD